MIQKITLITLAALLCVAGCKKDEKNDPVKPAPFVTSTSPVNNAIHIPVNNAVIVTFNGTMDASSFTTSSFTLMQDANPITGTITVNGAAATFTPANNLEANKVYAATVTTAVKNEAGTALAANYTFTFTTGDGPDLILPTINSTDPLDVEKRIERNKTITVTFSEAMNALTIDSNTFMLKDGTNDIKGTILYNGTKATFTPFQSLAAATVYTATITTGAKDMAGNAIAQNKVWTFTTGGTNARLNKVELGSAADYVILAKTAINNISTSALTGALGLSPAATSYITGLSITDATGYANSAQVTGKIYAADMAAPTPVNLTVAVNNMSTAYTDAAGRPSPDFAELASGNIGGKTLSAGLYKWSSTVSVQSDITLSGDANDVWIFQVAGDFVMSSAVKITLNGGAQAKNIFWQVAGQATLGTTSHFEGNLLSMTGITFQTGASANGRLLAQTAVILDSNTITQPAD